MSTIAKLPYSEHKAMERMWIQEIGGGIAHMTSNMEHRLVEKGLIEVNDVEVLDKLGKIVLHIRRLTIRGHMACCEWYASQPDDNMP